MTVIGEGRFQTVSGESGFQTASILWTILYLPSTGTGTQKANRETVVDFTTPYYLETITLVSRAPAEKSRAFAVFSTFTTEVWVCILASTVAVGPLVSVVGRVVALYTERPPHRQLPEYSFHVFRSLVSQGNLLRPSNWPHRLLFFCWYLFCFYIYALYSGTLTAVLALPTYEKPIDGLVDLPKAVAEGYTIGTIGDTSLEFIFKVQFGPISPVIYSILKLFGIYTI
ncbi:glutamate receptor ionotropic, delta-1-like [Procambarus clarkii]|uniref:glutamate receptor ionotropic, delta-1-like n=1 Tax=Procambarus clarkii TaxID=6728 RepID=UPI0037441CB9